MTDLPSFPFAVSEGVEPPPEYAELRRCPVLPTVRLANGREAKLATRHQDVRLVLSDPRFSRAAYEGTLFARSPESLPLITVDAPDHTRRRSAVAHAFTARRVRELAPMVEEVAKAQLAELAESGSPADLVADYTVPFTQRVMCRVLGLPEEDIPLFRQWVDPMMSAGRYPAEAVAEAHAGFQAYVAAFVTGVATDLAAGRAAQGLVADMLNPRSPERALSPVETVVMTAGMLVAGYETTSNALATVIHHLLRHPELLDRPIDPVIAEILRYVCGNATGGVPHVAMEDVELSHGQVVRAGEVVIPIPDAANRDPDVFADPDTLDFDRAENPHVAFGYGAHHCVGAELARVELRIGVTALLGTFPDLRIAAADATLRWRTDMYIRGLWELPVAW
ncbi:cytochrome P450 [Actinokineospora sp. UTMC 2448]|uniref:cytochrome P450 n=1 Tax=Actinokineospora sp. UTMC 2448 TaxID=2268449 RepID=UPI002164966F|nr:cytochrome P450 [Actinokineospora sp. UTMC 2448]UVS79517.1 Cytochrome P450-SU1 [Actinokineospora sp. UTMC 2448]